MTESDKRRIRQLQIEGLGYKRIAAMLDLPVNSVKSHCYRHPVDKEPEIKLPCQYCGKKVLQQPHRKEKKFCSDQCRMAWWKEHTALINRKKLNQYICPLCGTAFTSPHSHRIYCSRECYAKARMKGGLDHE